MLREARVDWSDRLRSQADIMQHYYRDIETGDIWRIDVMTWPVREQEVTVQQESGPPGARAREHHGPFESLADAKRYIVKAMEAAPTGRKRSKLCCARAWHEHHAAWCENREDAW